MSTQNKLAEALDGLLKAIHTDNPEGLPLQFRGAANIAEAALAEHESCAVLCIARDRMAEDRP